MEALSFQGQKSAAILLDLVICDSCCVIFIDDCLDKGKTLTRGYYSALLNTVRKK